jgi:hypothetical protein
MSSPPTPQTPHGPDDAGIPLLTDIVPQQRYRREEIPPSLADVDWASLALKVQENAMQRLLHRTQPMLGGEVQTALRTVVERTTEALALQLQDVLTQLIGDLVSRAVTVELTRLPAQIAARGTSESPQAPD